MMVLSMAWRGLFLLAASTRLWCAPQPPAFEVASVKIAVEPSREPMFCVVPCAPGERFVVMGDRVDIRFMPLSSLIAAAYRVKERQVSGPDWIGSARFDIVAKIPAGASKDRVPEMLQALLTERFHVEVHRDSREQPVYALVVGRNGPKLKPSAAAADAKLLQTAGGRGLLTPYGEGRMLPDGGFLVTGGEFGPVRGGRGAAGGMRLEFLRLTMPALANMLSPHVDRPVVDRTNLDGAYDFASENRPAASSSGGRKGDTPQPASSSDPPARADAYGDALLTAMEKAGLKLEPRRAAVGILVVDRAEKPSAN